MGYLFYSACFLWCVVIAVLVILKLRFWPPVFAFGVPVLRQRHVPLANIPAVGSVLGSSHGNGKVIGPGRILFLGAKPSFRSPAALTATIDVQSGAADIVARIPADAVCAGAFWVGLSLSLSGAIFVQGGGAAVALLAALLGVGLVCGWWLTYFRIFLGSRKQDVVIFVEQLDTNLLRAQA